MSQQPTHPCVIRVSLEPPKSNVGDLRVVTDGGITMSMSSHMTKVAAGSFAVLRQLRSVLRSLSRESLTDLIVALVLTRLDSSQLDCSQLLL